MIIALVIILVVLFMALWISTMALWWKHEQGQEQKTINRDDAVRAFNKAARLARRSLYTGQRYTKKAVSWGEKKATDTFIRVFPKSKSAFTTQDPMTGLEHGPSSYFLASISPASAKATARRRKTKKKIEPVTDLSEE